MLMNNRPRVIIIGAGFGGLFAARTLAHKAVDVLLIDRNNYHTFTPLLYQVATSALGASDIAYPVRTIFQRIKNIETVQGTVTAIDYNEQVVQVEVGDLTYTKPYDYLILATGSTPTYFGNDHFREHALELRTLEDALYLRNQILVQFERAAWIDDPAIREALTTIVVVGGGPTGIETAGAIYELYNHVLSQEYAQRELKARVILVELQEHLLGPYPKKLQEAALKQLRSLGVEVILGKSVKGVTEEIVTLSDGSEIPSYTLVWATGVKASPVAEMMQVELARGGRLPIHPTTEVIDRKNVYAVGDMVYLKDPEGNPYPMLIPVAQQQGILAAKNILADIAGEPQKPFEYKDKGIMATIGRRRAVAWIFNKIPLTGFVAWLAWLGLHLVTLLGFRNRVQVFVNWVWNYFTYDRSVRLILNRQKKVIANGDKKLVTMEKS